ncbi:MAG: acetyl-CoA carboxylase biotin carboxyl carrier protein subunit [Chloroflexi bacterium]|nr:acetyl-CoA carboxylase biotin carboxyl carrier protein subunit [Chloroflexota bacterium]
MVEVRSNMAGTVYLINVQQGDSVQAGDEVVVLESMKMEMPIPALDGGTVKELLVQIGDVVQEDDVLMVLE